MTDAEPALVSIVLATFNERENIADTIQSIFKHVREPAEVVVVDDNSPDQTWKLVAEMNDPRVKLIRRVGTRGLASAFLRGIMEARGEYVGWMDADMCMPPELLPQMLELLREHDIVIGSRYVKGAQDNRSRLRVIASQMINRFATIILGYGIQDYDSGFVLLRRSVFNYALPIPIGYGEYFIEFTYTCCRKGLKVKEIPYIFTDRAKGVSKSAPSLVKFMILGTQYVLRIIRAKFRRVD